MDKRANIEVGLGDSYYWRPVNEGSYPCGEPWVKVEEFFPRVNVDRVLLRPTNLQELYTGLFFLDALRERGIHVKKLFLPCVPGARQDRVMGVGGDFLLTAKSIARDINARGIPEVIVADPHSDVIASLIDRCLVVSTGDLLHATKSIGTYAGVIAPDAGAMKRATDVAQALGMLAVIHAWKKRSVVDGRLTGFGMEPCPNVQGSWLVVDDICDGGGTFLGLGELLRENNVNADLYVTHGYFTNPDQVQELLGLYGRVLTTNSVRSEKPEGVEEIDILPTLVDIAYNRSARRLS